MHKSSPYYSFHPNSIGWLHRRDVLGEEILKKDILRLLKVSRENANDSVLQRYLVPAFEGRLNPKRGRKARPPMHDWRVMAAASAYQERRVELRAEYKRGVRVRLQGDLEPSIQAADEIAAEFSLGTGRSMLNAISSLKKRLFERNASAQTG